MRIVLRDTRTNELVVEIFDMIEEGLTEEDINELMMDTQGYGEETLELLQNDNYYISYEER